MEDIAATIRFCDICVMLERIKQATMPGKESYLRRYYESFLSHREEFRKRNDFEKQQEETGFSSFYCVLRCIIPGSDTARSPYGLQVTSLGRVYIKVLQLSQDSPEAEVLYGRAYSSVRGDYADKIYSILYPRSEVKPSNLTLKQVHEMLDTIATDDRRGVEKVISELFEIASADEQKWFIRLLLKSMHLGIGEQRVFNVLHPQAKQLYQHCVNLSRVCCLLADNNFTMAVEEPSNATTAPVKEEFNLHEAIQLFEPLKPMLCERYSGNIETLMAEDVLYVETKMDGERFQMHYRDGQFKYISRNGNDYTSSFGETKRVGTLSPALSELLPIGLDSIILDGEMMVWDTSQKRFREKGENTDVKHLSGKSSWRPCFILYDLLYLDGYCMLSIPYVQRSVKLRGLFKDSEGVLQVMKPKKLSTIDNYIQEFQKALDANEEGIVIKKQSSHYKPGCRQGGGWYKFKADYVEGLTTDFDLLIIGGFYNRTQTFITSFLLGVLKYTSDQQYEVYSVGKVNNITRSRVPLFESLKPHWHQMTSNPPPMWYHYNSKNADGRPDVWIEPPHSTILQIKATDLTPSSAFVLKKSLHFPRTVAWRNDKVWNECMSLQEYTQLSETSKGIKKIHKRPLQIEDVGASGKRKRTTPAQARKNALRALGNTFDASKVRQTSVLLEDFSVCILSDTIEHSLESIKKLVVQNGGAIVENPIKNDVRCLIVAGDITFRVKTLIKSKRHEILKLSWLLRVCERKEIKMKPKDLIYMSENLKEQFSENYDEYGDSYTEKLDMEELKALLDDITDEQIASTKLSAEDALDFETELFGEEFFRNIPVIFYTTDESSVYSSLLYQLRGGVCVDRRDSRLFATVKYIFLNPIKIDKLKFMKWLRVNFSNYLKDLQIVTIKWILKSHTDNKKLDIDKYIVQGFWNNCGNNQ